MHHLGKISCRFLSLHFGRIRKEASASARHQHQTAKPQITVSLS